MIASISKQPDAIHVYFTASNEHEEALVFDVGEMIASDKFRIIPMVMHPKRIQMKGPVCVCLLIEPKTPA